MVTVCPGYSQLCKAELGLGLGWGCLVSPVRLTHSYASSLTVGLAKIVRLIHIHITTVVRLTHIYIPSVRLTTHIHITTVRLIHIYIPSVRLTRIYILQV